MDKRYFFQDFLFEELPIDDQDFPKFELLPKPDILNDNNVTISFDRLLRLNKVSEWEDVFSSIKDKVTIIKDDVLITNDELEEYKKFYLKTYAYLLNEKSFRCFVEY